jgi:hypothetical protein
LPRKIRAWPDYLEAAPHGCIGDWRFDSGGFCFHKAEKARKIDPEIETPARERERDKSLIRVRASADGGLDTNAQNKRAKRAVDRERRE